MKIIPVFPVSDRVKEMCTESYNMAKICHDFVPSQKKSISQELTNSFSAGLDLYNINAGLNAASPFAAAAADSLVCSPG
jgi:hypothetical protein